MADFDVAMPAVLRNEGGLVDNPKDPGGITNHGISLSFYQKNIKKWADKYDIRDLTVDDATAIYREHFWDPNHYNMIASQKIATKVFDIGINIGPANANKCLQRAVLAASNMIIAHDGILGARSLFAINHSSTDALYAAFKADVAAYYRNLVKDEPKLDVFLNGWLNRCYSDN